MLKTRTFSISVQPCFLLFRVIIEPYLICCLVVNAFSMDQSDFLFGPTRSSTLYQTTKFWTGQKIKLH